MNYIPKYFSSSEFVSSKLYHWCLDNKVDPFSFMHPDILIIADQIREYFNKPCLINTWKWGGVRQYSGYREIDCTVGAPHSQHRLGKAVDMLVDGYNAEDVRTAILSIPESFPLIRRIEAGVNWLHLDIKETGKKKIVLFRA